MRQQSYPGLRPGIVLASLFIASMALSFGAMAVELTESHARPAQIGLDKADIKARKADAVLAEVLTEYEQHEARQQPIEAFKPSNTLVRVVKGRVLIDARAEADGESLANDLAALGLTEGSRYGSMVSGYLPLGAIKKMLALDSLRVAFASLAKTRTGAVTSQGDAAMKADSARSTYGVNGTGVTVGVLSDSYNCKNGAATDQKNLDLPAVVTVLDDTACASSGTDEGRAMMQIVYDVAPGAGLAFHTAFKGMADFANGIKRLAASPSAVPPGAGAKVIVDDVLYFYEPMFQDGIIAQAVDTVVAGGAAYFSAAGNDGRNGYARPFANSGEVLTVDGAYSGFLHDFAAGSGKPIDWLQAVTIPKDRTVYLCYQWDQPFGGSTVDMDIYLVNYAGTAVVTKSAANNNKARGGSGDPAECLQFTNSSFYYSFFGTQYNIMLAFYSSGAAPPGPTNPPPNNLVINQQYVLFKSVGTPGVTEYRTDSGTLYGHANAAGAEAVGAAFYDFTQASPFACAEGRPAVTAAMNSSGTVRLECYSSAGGVPIFFDANGNRLGSPDYRRKPDITAPDGGNTTFFGFDIVKDPLGVPYASDPDTYPNFFGTSAAAPHAAGVAALLLSSNGNGNPSLSPAGLYGRLDCTAVDMSVALSDSFDHDSGWGFIQADAAVAKAPSLANYPPTVNADSYSVNTDNTLEVTSPGVLKNDCDLDGDALTASLNSGFGPTHGSLSLNANGSFSYTPVAGYSGPDSFSYIASDGKGGTATGAVTITVGGNHAPMAVDDCCYKTPKNTTLKVPAPGVLGNDYDVDKDALTATLIPNSLSPNKGALVWYGTGAFDYSPPTGFSGKVTFKYQANDGKLSSNTATVTITVTK